MTQLTYANVNNNITAVVDVSIEFNTRDNKLRKDADGYYIGVPLAVLNKVSLNKTYYEAKEAIEAITSRNSLFNHRLRQGLLIGEYNHPILFDLPLKIAIQRLLWLEPKYESHTFKKVYVKEVPKIGHIIFGDLKPSGPYKEHMVEKLEDPTMNCAFSLRALTKDIKDPRGFIRRKILKLVTFDGGVPAGGFEEASKTSKVKMIQEGLLPSTESINSGINIPNFETTLTPSELEEYITNCNISLESLFTQYELTNIFGFKRLKIKERSISIINKRNNILVVDGNPNEEGKIETSKIKSPIHVLF